MKAMQMGHFNGKINADAPCHVTGW